MDWNLVVTDMGGRNRAFPDAWDTITVTRRLDSYCEGTAHLNIYDQNAKEILCGQRAMKFYRGTSLKLYGTIWEPLDIGNPSGISIAVRDPFGYYAWRRVRAVTTYTAQDAGAIAQARVVAQNGYGNTFLRMGAIQTSVNRTMSVNPGKREDEVFTDLAGMFQGFFFLVNPVDNVAGIFSEMLILYPNAGSTRSEVRFEFGENSLDNLIDYKVSYALPLNRVTAASSATSGGRIAQTAEDTTSEALYGIIEDELDTSSDVPDTAVLMAFAAADVRTVAPETYTITPNLNSPLLFQDFDVGDFVRMRIKDGPIDISTWVRVVEATLSVDVNGTEKMTNLVLETLIGDKPTPSPQDAFKAYLDLQRQTTEALARKVQTLNVAIASPPTTGAGSSPGSDLTYTPPAAPPVAPPVAPPAPDTPPAISNLTAYDPLTTNSGTVEFDCNAGTLDTSTSVSMTPGTHNADGGGQGANTSGHHVTTIGGLAKNTTYTVTVTATNAAGSVSATTTFHTSTVVGQ